MATTEAHSVSNSFYNASLSIFPSPNDLLLAFPRLARRAWTYLPEQFDTFFTLARGPGTVIADATSKGPKSNASFLASGTASQTPIPTATSSPHISVDGFRVWLQQSINIHKISNLDGVGSYLVSKWAWVTFIMAFLLNRTQVYTAPRRPITLYWHARLLLRMVPIMVFLTQLCSILQAMRCQTGTYLYESKYAEFGHQLNSISTSDNHILNTLSSTLLFWQTEQESCKAVRMIPSEQNPGHIYGSFSLLWPLFLALCGSQFVKSVSCSLQGQQVITDTSMSLFEHSMAFSEADSLLRSSVGIGLFGLPKSPFNATEPRATLATSSAVLVLGADAAGAAGTSLVVHYLNVPPEVLLVCLISCASHLSSHILGVLELQSKFRLVHTSIWGISFMTAFLWEMFKIFRSGRVDDLSMIRYPTICIIGLLPHLVVMMGCLICAQIYGLALILTVISPPVPRNQRITLSERFSLAYNNLQANALFSHAHVKFSWHDDFYTTLLKFGFTVLGAATEAVYFNEGTNVTLITQTWLEEKRSREFLRDRTAFRQGHNPIPPEVQGALHIADGVGLVDEDQGLSRDGASITSGYAKERKTTKQAEKPNGAAATKEEGVGSSQRTGRWLMSWKLATEIGLLVLCCHARVIIAIMKRLGFTQIPRFLENTARYNNKNEQGAQNNEARPKTLDFWIMAQDGTLSLPEDTNVDVEVEMRKRLRFNGSRENPDEGQMDSHLYGWWKNGGWWGEVDTSGEYHPADLDDDMTSVISTELVESENVSVVENEGRQTPTQEDFPPHSSTRESTPSLVDEDHNARLADLLDPQNYEAKQEARLLARRLRSDGPMTRAAYNKALHKEKYRVLGLSSAPGQGLSPEDEEDILEEIILTRRKFRPLGESTTSGSAAGAGTSWAEGAEGMGDSGPQCVVCHGAPRTILVWPCRCLSLCEECRVSLAISNFGTCVCCRRDVVAFSRLFVP